MNIISPSGVWKWTLVDVNRRALASLRVNTSTVSASDVWAWSMHETLFLAFGNLDLAPTSRDLEVVGMAVHRTPLALDLSNGVCETIDSARALSTRKLYSSKWRVLESWCLANAVDPVNCPVGSVLEFLRHKFSAGVAATTLRVYVAAIAARRDSNDVPLGRHLTPEQYFSNFSTPRPIIVHNNI